ncbi:MAG: hypothetical protein RR840_09565 [Clostridium sp.]
MGNENTIGIKRTLKKESFSRKRDIVISIVLMAGMAYLVTALTSAGILKGFDSYFSFIYVIFVDLLLLLNIVKVLSEEKIYFEVEDDKLKIGGGYIDNGYLVPMERILYVDVISGSRGDFNVILVTKAGGRKKYKPLTETVVRKNTYLRDAYTEVNHLYSEESYSYLEIKRSGSRKYYLLYALYKSHFNINFSKKAIEYIKKFILEYNL